MLYFCVLNYKLNLCILLEFYGKNNLEAAYIDQILDTLQDLVTAAIPYMVESKLDKDKKVKNSLLFYSLIVPRRAKTCFGCIRTKMQTSLRTIAV